MGTKAVVETYGRLAAHYDRRWSFYIEATLRETLRRLALQPRERLLDVGCGTGVLMEAIAAAIPDVELAGADASPEMLAVARRRLGDGALLREGQAERLPFADGSFDVVSSTNAFHYFRDPVAALEEMARVLRPSGRLVITDWCDDYLACRICDLWLRLFDRAHFRTYGTEELRQLVEQAGFRPVRIDRYKISWLWGLMTAVGRRVAAESGERPGPPQGRAARWNRSAAWPTDCGAS